MFNVVLFTITPNWFLFKCSSIVERTIEYYKAMKIIYNYTQTQKRL